MNTNATIPFTYRMRTHQSGQFWLPAAIWAFFVIVIGFFGKSIPSVVEISISYIGVVLPLLGGILGAYAILDDPVLELHFASPRSAIQMLLERTIIIFGLLTICAITFQVFLHFLAVDLNSVWQHLDATTGLDHPLPDPDDAGGFCRLRIHTIHHRGYAGGDDLDRPTGCPWMVSG